MNNKKDILEGFDQIKSKFTQFAEQWKSGQKLNIKHIIGKKNEYRLILNELMNFYSQIINKPENISLIIQANLDLHTWNILTEKISLVIKQSFDPKHIGKNHNSIINILYSIIIDELRDSFNFFKNVYQVTCDFTNVKELPLFKSNVLNFMGDLKKLKIIFNKKFEKFPDLQTIEMNPQKDTNDSIKFYNYALKNNPLNPRIYSNLGFVYREFLENHMNSAYWFIRALSCVDNDMKKLKDNLEKDFTFIRKKLNNEEYIIDNNLENTAFLKYDIEHLPLLFYRIIGILFMNIDVDELNDLLNRFITILTKILIHYQKISDQTFRIDYEFKGQCVQMVILAIFSFHYNINGLQPYGKESKKIITNQKINKILNFDIYSHDIVKSLNEENIKANKKQSINFLAQYTKTMCKNVNKYNINFVEKYLLILFYWLSLNYDLYSLIIDDESKIYLQFINFYLQEDQDIKQLFNPRPQIALKMLLEKINTRILPIEQTFYGFLPMHRFFELAKKTTIYRCFEEDMENSNKIILIHFLNSFGLAPKNNEKIQTNFFRNNNQVNVKPQYIENQNDPSINQIKDKLTMREPNIISTVKKVKPLILLDASNVARRHGNDKIFSTKGIKIAMEYFNKNGHVVKSFLPDYLFKQKDPNSLLNKNTVMPDNLDYLNELSEQHLVIKTPPQDYDDSYCIQYAKKHKAFIVTNDLFRDYLDKIVDNKQRETERMWIQETRISYTFNQDEFLPNSDAAFFKEFQLEEYNRVAT